jgi:hypothetical protein
MQNLSRSEIVRLREQGYQLDGENWVRVPSKEPAPRGMKVAKVCNGDTLVVVLIPEDILSSAGHNNLH